jgi:hypothetical protein
MVTHLATFSKIKTTGKISKCLPKYPEILEGRKAAMAMASGIKQMGNRSNWLLHPKHIFKISLLMFPVLRRCSVECLFRLL